MVFLQGIPEGVQYLLLLGVAIGLLFGGEYSVKRVWKSYKSRHQGGKKMSRKRRKVKVAALISDLVVEALEDAVYKKKITREEATHWYNAIGRASSFELKDLFPRRVTTPPNPELLKAEINERLSKPKKVLPFPDGTKTRKPTSKLEQAFFRPKQRAVA